MKPIASVTSTCSAAAPPVVEPAPLLLLSAAVLELPSALLVPLELPSLPLLVPVAVALELELEPPTEVPSEVLAELLAEVSPVPVDAVPLVSSPQAASRGATEARIRTSRFMRSRLSQRRAPVQRDRGRTPARPSRRRGHRRTICRADATVQRPTVISVAGLDSLAHASFGPRHRRARVRVRLVQPVRSRPEGGAVR
jgi:hypothetical protein